ncbi:MAG: thiamine phosphate synthase [Rhodospirillales bacterium]|nr:thiamine phosphate synthase [Rhodospirillales bacterium]
MTDAQRGPEPEALVACLPTGAGLVFRHYGHPHRYQLAARVLDQCRKQGVFCLIAGDIRLALALGADGVHLPERMMQGSLAGLQTFRRRGGWPTAAAHSRAAALSAVRLGVDGLFVSPLFSTPSHPAAKGLGILRFRQIIRDLQCPVFALGGITADTLNRVAGAGVYGVAGISLFATAEIHEDSRKTGEITIKEGVVRKGAD